MKQKTLGSPAWLDPPHPPTTKTSKLNHWVGGRDVDSLQENRQLKTKEFDQGELSLSMPFWRGVQSSTQGRYVAS